MLHLLDRFPGLSRWLAAGRFRAVVGCPAPAHVRPERVQWAVGGVLLSYRPPLEQGGWLDGWDAVEAPVFLVVSADLVYDGWCKPSRAFHKVRPDNLLTIWVLADDEAARGIIHVV